MKIAYIPLDNRPCTMAFPRMLASCVNFTLIMPPEELLGNYMIPGDPAKLAQWLETIPPDTDAAILSIDMMIYGGLIASRSALAGDEEVQQNMLRLQDWLKRTRIQQIYAFNALMRNMPTYTSPAIQKEAPHFLKMLKELYEISQKAPHRLLASIEKARQSLTGAISPDYFDIRERNHRVNLQVLEWKKEHLLDYLILGLDDVVTRGLNIYEKQLLEKVIARDGIEDASLYPGTDEMAMMLLARLACRHFHLKPSYALHYSSHRGKETVPLYEDRSVSALLSSYIATLGGTEKNPKEADIQIFIHLFPRGQLEAAWQKVRKTGQWSVLPFVQEIRKSVMADEIAGVADIAFANGADISFSEALLARVKPGRLAAYASWNTAGNTIGTVIAHSTLRWLSLKFRRTLEDCEAAEKAHQVFLLSRFIDDWVFQTGARDRMHHILDKERISPFSLGKSHRRIEHMTDLMVVLKAREIFTKGFAGHYFLPAPSTVPARITIEGPFSCQIHLPWARLFEIAVDCDFTIRHVPLEEQQPGL